MKYGVYAGFCSHYEVLCNIGFGALYVLIPVLPVLTVIPFK